ncbi:hypothetical protein AAC387_Pa04g0486 [Persea americana]
MTRRKPHYMRHLEWGNWKIVKELLDACPSVVYMLNRDKESSLFIACSYGHMEVALELCSRIDFLAWDEIGASCLEIAASNGYTQVENCSAAGDIKMVDMTRLVNGLYFIAHSFAPVCYYATQATFSSFSFFGSGKEPTFRRHSRANLQPFQV